MALLASAKSKTDKNIIGLLNQVETSKYVVCAFENASEITIGSEPKRIIDVTFASIESTSVLFMGNVSCVVQAESKTAVNGYTASHLVPNAESIVARAVAEAKELEVIPEIEYETQEEEVTVPITRKVDPVVTFFYKIDDTWIEDYAPKQVLQDGENILPLLYPVSGLGANSAKQLEVYMSVEGGEITIAPACCKAAVAGSGIASGVAEWDGKIVIEESVNVVSMAENALTLALLKDSAGTRVWKETVYGFADSVSIMTLQNTMNLLGLADQAEIG